MDAIVLAGGDARRLGGADKPGQRIGERTLLEHVVAAVPTAASVVVVGPRRDVPRQVVWARENPPGGGPVAAVAAALPLTTADTVVLLAGDLPWIHGAIAPLLAELDAHECAVLVDAAGRRNPLASAWRRDALHRAVRAVGATAGAAAHALLDGVDVGEVADSGGWGEDCDTWDDLARARARALPTDEERP
jgi:molybdopterin-guanine dinucleotide biosynthesis protein A